MSIQPSRFNYLESLRGLAALSVALFHFEGNKFLFNNSFIGNGWLMVDFFFVLSGFVIALNYQSKMLQFNDLVVFQLKRFLRLYPLHMLMLLTFLALEFSKLHQETQTGLIGQTPAFSLNTLGSFIHNIFLTHNLFLEEVTWNGVSWSISAEFYTYMVFAFIALATKNSRARLLVASACIVSLSFVFFSFQPMSPGNGFVRCLYSFFLGVATFNFTNSASVNIRPLFSYISFGVAILAVAMSPGENYSLINIHIPILFALFIYSLVKSGSNNGLIRVLENRQLVYLGSISYGIYMIHPFFVVLMRRGMFGFGPSDISSNDIKAGISGANLSSDILTLFSYILIVLVIAHLSYKVIEMPANSLRQRL